LAYLTEVFDPDVSILIILQEEAEVADPGKASPTYVTVELTESICVIVSGT
jgi:hypothetical protein